MTKYRYGDVLTGGRELYKVAAKKAFYSSSDWLFWMNREGQCFAARLCGATIKAAMLATGTNPEFHIRLFHARSSGSSILRWNAANLVRRNTLFAEGNLNKRKRAT